MAASPVWIEKHYRFGLAGESQANIIARLLSSRPGRVLDLGCGPEPRHVVNLSYHSKLLVAADHDYQMVIVAARRPEVTNIRLVAAEAYTLPFAARSFDHIVALGLFAYINDPGTVFREFRRVARPSANVLLTNSVARPKQPLIDAANAAGFTLSMQDESFCPSASGGVKMRYLLVFTSHEATAA